MAVFPIYQAIVYPAFVCKCPLSRFPRTGAPYVLSNSFTVPSHVSMIMMSFSGGDPQPDHKVALQVGLCQIEVYAQDRGYALFGERVHEVKPRARRRPRWLALPGHGQVQRGCPPTPQVRVVEAIPAYHQLVQPSRICVYAVELVDCSIRRNHTSPTRPCSNQTHQPVICPTRGRAVMKRGKVSISIAEPSGISITGGTTMTGAK